MKTLYWWNIRGVAKNYAILALKRLILTNKPDMVFLAEPSMDVNNFPKDWLGKLDLKPFAFNNMLHLLPTLWCLGKSNLSHVVIYSDDQQVTFTLPINNKLLGFCHICFYLLLAAEASLE